MVSEQAKALLRAIGSAQDGAGTLAAKDSVKLVPADWHAVCEAARQAADEIGRLPTAAAIPPSGEAVAWQYSYKMWEGGWSSWSQPVLEKPTNPEWRIRPLFAAPPAPVAIDEAMVERIAREIDPFAFKSWQLSYDYEIGQSGDPQEATAFANWSGGRLVEEAKEAARRVLAALSPQPNGGA